MPVLRIGKKENADGGEKNREKRILNQHTNMITCKAGGDTASVMARTACSPSRDGNDQLGPQLCRVSLQMRNAQRRRSWPVQFQTPEDCQFEMSPKHNTRGNCRGYLLSKQRLKEGVLGSPCSLFSPAALAAKGTRDRGSGFALSGYPHEALFEPAALTSRFAEEEIKWQTEMRGRAKME